MKKTLNIMLDREGIDTDSTFHDDMLSIMKEATPRVREKFKEGTFRRLFWDQQLLSAEKEPKQMRWHPTIVR